MPLFKRADGTLVKDLTPERRIMPYIMRRRNECAVYVDCPCDVTSAKKWLWAYNRAVEGEKCTFLHLFLYFSRFVIQEFPQIDRFVSGRRIYQRKASTISLSIKESLSIDAPVYSVKFPVATPGETLPQYSAKLSEVFKNASQHHERTEKEIAFYLKFPDFIIRLIAGVRNLLDQWNLLPGSMIDDDPLYTSIYAANIGSLGLPEAYHHLYEHGNCSAFVTISSLKKSVVADGDGNVTTRDILPLRWTIDDRIADGFVCGLVLKRIQSFLENPSQYLGAPDEAAQGRLPQLVSAPVPQTSQSSRL